MLLNLKKKKIKKLMKIKKIIEIVNKQLKNNNFSMRYKKRDVPTPNPHFRN